MLLPIIVSFALSPDGSAEAQGIFAASEKKLKEARTLAGKLVGRHRSLDLYQWTFLLQKPRSFRVKSGKIDMYGNGQVQFNHFVPEKEYFRRDVSKEPRMTPPLSGLETFFGYATGEPSPYFIKTTEFGMRNVDGRPCAAKALQFESFGRGDRMIYYVDAKTEMPIGWDQVFGGTEMHYRFSELRLNVPVPAGAFDWKPSQELKERGGRRSGQP